MQCSFSYLRTLVDAVNRNVQMTTAWRLDRAHKVPEEYWRYLEAACQCATPSALSPRPPATSCGAAL